MTSRSVRSVWHDDANETDARAALLGIAGLNEENERANEELREDPANVGRLLSNAEMSRAALAITDALRSRTLTPGPLSDAAATELRRLQRNFRDAVSGFVDLLSVEVDVSAQVRALGTRFVTHLNDMTNGEIERWRNEWNSLGDHVDAGQVQIIARKAASDLELAQRNYDTAENNRRAAIRYANSLATRPLTDAERRVADQSRVAATDLADAAQANLDQAMVNRRLIRPGHQHGGEVGR